GTHVEIDRLTMHETEPAVELAGVRIADPFDPMRNLVEAARIQIELERNPLLERKLVIRHLAIESVRIGTARSRPAPPAPRDGFAAQALSAVKDWREQFDVPLLSLTPIDTIRSIVLDPLQLQTVQRAMLLRTETDSVRAAVTASYAGLALRETLDSARTVAERLQGRNPLQLGIGGTRQAIADVRRTLTGLQAARQRVEELERSTRSGLELLAAGVRQVDAAREADFAFARSLLQLPTFAAPDIGNAVFGQVTIDRFQQLVYWSELAQDYLPPGLDPRRKPGPQRARAAGTTVRFVQARSYPSFLLRRGDLDLTISGDGVTSGTYRVGIANLTTAPEVIGQPMRFALSRTGGGAGVSLRGGGVMDHLRGRMRDSMTISAAGVPLPSFDIPGLPLRAELGRGTSRLTFDRTGDQIRGSWNIRAADVGWAPEVQGRPLNLLEELAVRVITGLDDIELSASVSGTMQSPALSVRSNLDRVLAARVREVLGEEVARAERDARAQVERIVRERAAPIQAEAQRIRTETEQQIADARARLDTARTELEGRLRSLGVR
ncbi:MAG TPA: hypothetical protein VMM77_04100, partial [Gemmatimonadaceae bacterium]|nr:hypothetical protein [Gemmatimonadaceae bacterium]